MPILTSLPVKPSWDWATSAPVRDLAWSIWGEVTPSSRSAWVRAESASVSWGAGTTATGETDTTWSRAASFSTLESSTLTATPFHSSPYLVVTEASMSASSMALTRASCSAEMVAELPPAAWEGEASSTNQRSGTFSAVDPSGRVRVQVILLEGSGACCGVAATVGAARAPRVSTATLSASARRVLGRLILTWYFFLKGAVRAAGNDADPEQWTERPSQSLTRPLQERCGVLMVDTIDVIFRIMLVSTSRSAQVHSGHTGMRQLQRYARANRAR